MGAKASTQSGEAASPPRTRTFSTSSNSEVVAGPAFSLLRALPSVTGDRQRTRSLSGVGEAVSGGVRAVRTYDISESAETDSGEEGGPSLPSLPSLTGLPPNIRVYSAHSLPSHIWTTYGIKCPMCGKFLLPDDIECHLVMCLTKPRLSYNEDVLAEEKGECVICLEELSSGDTIARLPCLCIYHKGCIDRWFEVNRSCPEHPGD